MNHGKFLPEFVELSQLVLGLPWFFWGNPTCFRERRDFIGGVLRVVSTTLSKFTECTWFEVVKDTAWLRISKSIASVLIRSSSLVDWAGCWLGELEIAPAPFLCLPVMWTWTTLKLYRDVLYLRNLLSRDFQVEMFVFRDHHQVGRTPIRRNLLCSAPVLQPGTHLLYGRTCSLLYC